MKRLVNFLYVFILVGFSSCFQEDNPVPPYVSPPGVTTTVAAMGPDYGLQMYYDLETDSFIRIVDRETWDLAFQCGDNEYRIYTNLAKHMSVANTGVTDFSAVTSGTGLTYKFDRSEGYVDSVAIGNWGDFSAGSATSHNDVYVIDRGITTVGANIGKKKMQVIGLVNGTYQIHVANLDGTNDQVISVTKNPNHSFVHVSLNGAGSVVNIEPDKFDWDLVFTQYTAKVTQISTGITEDYSVNGVLLNPYMVQIAHDFTKPFADVLYTDLAGYSYSTFWDAIGYDWKYYDFDLQIYVIESTRTYIVKTVEGNYYKLRFTSFTNDLGVKGYPKFEFSKF